MNTTCLGQIIPTDTHLGFPVVSLKKVGDDLKKNPAFIKDKHVTVYVEDSPEKWCGATLAVAEWAQTFIQDPTLHVIARKTLSNLINPLNRVDIALNQIKLNWQNEPINKNELTVLVTLQPCLQHEPVAQLKNWAMFEREEGYAWVERYVAVAQIHFEQRYWSSQAVSIGIPVPIDCVDDYLKWKDSKKGPKSLEDCVKARFKTSKDNEDWDWYQCIAGISKRQVLEKLVLNALGLFK